MSIKRSIIASCFFILGTLSVYGEGKVEGPRPLAAQSQAAQKTITMYIVRHGQTILNLMDKVQGWSDGTLTEKGAQGAINLGKGLRDITFDGVYSSDLGRARETARLVMEQNRATPQWVIRELPEIREVNFGKFEGDPNYAMYAALAADLGLPVPEDQNMGKLMGPIIGYFHNDMVQFLEGLADFNKRVDTKYGIAESAAEVYARIQAGLDTIIAAHEPQGGTIMVVAHGQAITYVLKTMGLDLSTLPPTGLANSSVSKIIYTNRNYTIESFNDMSYLEAGANMK